jgi:hypothetical protein
MHHIRGYSSVGILALVIGLAAAGPARAAFHFWGVKEVFTNFDGTVQFIELFTNQPSESFVQGHVLTVMSDTNTASFTLNSNVGSNTANRHMLFATPGFAALAGGVTPTFTIPANFIKPDANSITVTWSSGFDTLTFPGSQLPKNGVHSLTDAFPIPGTGTSLSVGVNSPTNFNGAGGSVNVPIPGDTDVDGKVDVADLGTLATNWQTSGTRAQGDFDGSGFIDVNDLGLLATNWQVGVTAATSASHPTLADALARFGLGAAPVPEPAAGVVPAVALICRRRWRGRTHRVSA